MASLCLNSRIPRGKTSTRNSITTWRLFVVSDPKHLAVPEGTVIPPNRVLENTDNDNWSVRSSESDEYEFCHNDLSQYNIIVDPATLKIKAIIDWEYAGFFPPYFEAPFYKRPGPSVALDGERDDVPELLQFLNARSSDQ